MCFVDLRRHRHALAGHRREPLLNRVKAVGRQGLRAGHLGANHVLPIGQQIVIRRGDLLEQREAVAIGQQDEQLRYDGGEPRSLRDLLHRGSLARRRNRRVQHKALQRGLLLEERDEFVELAGELFEVRRFLGGDVECGASVTGSGSAAGHYLVRVGPTPTRSRPPSLRDRLKSSTFCLVIDRDRALAGFLQKEMSVLLQRLCGET